MTPGTVKGEAGIIEVVMPQMGESLSEGTIVRWLKQPGDAVGHDEPLFELSTDKVDTDVPAPAAGVLATILAQEGETVAVGTAVAIIRTAGAPSAAAVAAAPRAVTEEATAVAPAPESAGHFKSSHKPQLVSFRRGGLAPVAPSVSTSTPDARPVPPPAVKGPRAQVFSPAVIGDAQRAGLSLGQLTSIPGSGRSGRITKRDVQRFLESGGRDAVAAAVAPAAPRARAGPPPEFIYRPTPADRVQPMSTVRKRIARHMKWSARISPHATAQSEIDMSAVVAVLSRRDAFRTQVGAPLTYTVFAAAACVRALGEFEVLNSSIVGDQIVIKPSINLGIAVALADTDELIVPVVRGAEGLSLIGLARAIDDVASRARTRQLKPADVQGGTFTLTNPGIFGGITGTPILNQPQVGILSLGAVRKTPVVVDDEITIRPMMAIALTFDHRATDGMVAFRFLARVRELLERLPEDWQWTV